MWCGQSISSLGATASSADAAIPDYGYAPHFEIQAGDSHGVAVALYQIFTAERALGIRHGRTILANLVFLPDRAVIGE